MPSVAMILTSHHELGDTGRPTGWFVPEAAHPWRILVDAGYDLTWLSPLGGTAPAIGADRTDPIQAAFLDEYGDEGPATVSPDAVEPDDLDAVFFVGGHGTMWDLPNDERLARLTATVYERGGVVAAVCHGPAGLVEVRLSDGTPLVAGKQVAAFTDAEEAAVGLTDVVPFLLARRLTDRGARHRPGPDFEAKVVTDGRLITGQNPASAAGVAEAVVSILRGRSVVTSAT